MLKAGRLLNNSRYTGSSFSRQLQLLNNSLDSWRHAAQSNVQPLAQFDPLLLLESTRGVQEAARGVSLKEDSPSQEPENTTTYPVDVRQSRDSFRHDLLGWDIRGLLTALHDFARLLEGEATTAAGRGALLLTGEAGQGKTHIFCDAAQRAIDAGQCAVLLLGERFSGRNVWFEISEQLGLGQVGSEVLLGAMQAAAVASNKPFLLLMDALNDAERPKAWKDELPSFLGEITNYPWISVGISVRSTYQHIVLPDDGLPDIPTVEHRGFADRELEAVERYFDVFGLEQPGMPLLVPEFTNPLFLKLYCEGLKDIAPGAPSEGEVHVSDAFERYLSAKEGRIANWLDLDPWMQPVRSAINAMCKALTDANRDTLSRRHATEIINAFAPGRNQWPKTMLGALLSEDVLTADMAWDTDSAEPIEAVRFTYQRLADYQVGSALLQPIGDDPERLRAALSEGQPLRRHLLQAPSGWIEALAVQVPEKFGVELLDVFQWQSEFSQRRWWDEAFVKSIAARRPSAVTDRSRELLGEVQRRSRTEDSFQLVLETILSVASSPDHPLNGNFLHGWLKSLTMPERDALWTISTYFAFDYGGTLDRLIRWAARGPYPDCSDEVVELATIPVVWTFTSPNRGMRDYATKALAKLLSGHLSVLLSLIRRFDGVDDPYVIEPPSRHGSRGGAL